MPKNPAAHQIVGHRCPDSGECYALGDARLVGYGNPPGSPGWQKKNPGKGQLAMPLQAVPVDRVSEAHRPDESDWIPRPADERKGISLTTDEE